MIRRHFSMLRDFHLADWLTLANAFCGVSAVFCALRYMQSGNKHDLLIGAALVPLAFVFDALDGRVARWRQSSSTLGRELDSLADVISFGVAPAALGFAAGLQGFWDWLVLGYFVCCGVSRLARFNITAEQLAGEDDKVKYFEGTPIPTSLALVVMLVVAVDAGRIGHDFWFGAYRAAGGLFHPLVLAYALSGSLMISKTLRIPKW
jgi:CDP-diacylglycerol--serine O-phosphatidyltransferase